MDPAPLVFNGSSSIIVTSGNVTIRATKADRALQVFIIFLFIDIVEMNFSFYA